MKAGARKKDEKNKEEWGRSVGTLTPPSSCSLNHCHSPYP
jgi:hypothetical protein